MRWMSSVSGDIRFVLSYLLASFGHVQNFKRTPLDTDVRWMSITRAFVCGLSGSTVVCPVLMCSASCRYPVCIRWCPFHLSCEWSTTAHVKEFHGRVPHVHSVIVQLRFCPFLIRHISILSVILYIHLLTVFCLLLIRFVCAPYDFRDDLHRHWDDFHHRINSIFSVLLASLTFIR